jgi:hypothetical protein
MSQPNEKTLYLCSGLQGSGSSLISWCFLQRADMNGIFDTAHDMVPNIPEGLNARHAWCKITICSFRATELIDYFGGLGWAIRPLMVVRDVREIWASLTGKNYGRNGTTAEDPPLRIRMQRFHADWQRSVKEQWPTIRYESLVQEPIGTLKKVCQTLELPWDQGMADWPKSADQIADARYGNVNFLASRSGGLLGTIKPEFVGQIKGPIASRDLEWLETRFADFNRACDYPEHREVLADEEAFAQPSFEVTRRFVWKQQEKPESLMRRLGLCR